MENSVIQQSFQLCFENVEPGIHTVYVETIKMAAVLFIGTLISCISILFRVDGYNDNWTIKGVMRLILQKIPSGI
jgi:hypothetical protein